MYSSKCKYALCQTVCNNYYDIIIIINSQIYIPVYEVLYTMMYCHKLYMIVTTNI